MLCRQVQASDIVQWSRLRKALWPDSELLELERECEQMLQCHDKVCFVATDNETLHGFIEAAIYQDQSQPYCHVEGWYVGECARGQGLGQQLMAQVEHWALHRAIAWLTSDTTAKYPISPKAHAKANFTQARQMSIFIKSLATKADSGNTS